VSAVSSVFQRLTPAVNLGVALCAQRNQVQLGIVAGVAAELPVMNFQIRHRTTRLTAPAIALQDLLPKSFIRDRIKP